MRWMYLILLPSASNISPPPLRPLTNQVDTCKNNMCERKAIASRARQGKPSKSNQRKQGTPLQRGSRRGIPRPCCRIMATHARTVSLDRPTLDCFVLLLRSSQRQPLRAIGEPPSRHRHISRPHPSLTLPRARRLALTKKK